MANPPDLVDLDALAVAVTLDVSERRRARLDEVRHRLGRSRDLTALATARAVRWGWLWRRQGVLRPTAACPSDEALRRHLDRLVET